MTRLYTNIICEECGEVYGMKPYITGVKSINDGVCFGRVSTDIMDKLMEVAPEYEIDDWVKVKYFSYDEDRVFKIKRFSRDETTGKTYVYFHNTDSSIYNCYIEDITRYASQVEIEKELLRIRIERIKELPSESLLYIQG